MIALPGPLVDVDWLAARLGEPTLHVVDATWYMPAENRPGRDEFRTAHIPGAVFFDIDEIADRSSDLPHMLPPPDAFADAAARLGLSADEAVVVYDGQGVFSAPRVWWTLRVMGFSKVAVLDGGLPAWRAAGHPLQSGDPSERAAAQPEAPRVRADLVRNLDQVQATLESGSAQVVDARPAPRFRGQAPEPRPGLRGGHMPGAANLPWSALVADGRVRAPAELEAAFEKVGVSLDHPIVATCGSGVSAAVLALGLAILGRDDAAIYDGSWSEWGGRSDTAVVTGP